MSNDWENASFEKTMEFSMEAQKRLFLLNGAAAVAVLSFYGSISAKISMLNGWPLILYCLGTCFSIAGFFLTREGQMYFTYHNNECGIFLNKVVTVNIVLSMICFLSGSHIITISFFALPPIRIGNFIIPSWCIIWGFFVISIMSYFISTSYAKRKAQKNESSK